MRTLPARAVGERRIRIATNRYREVLLTEDGSGQQAAAVERLKPGPWPDLSVRNSHTRRDGVQEAADVVDDRVARVELAGVAVQPVPFDESDDRGVFHHDVGDRVAAGEASDGERRQTRSVRHPVDQTVRWWGHVIEIPATLVICEQDERAVAV